ncbi:MAG: hypothetical protein OXG35_14445 [Acidobacteria bacterium]|nr:hypothetical protein [Acidobacteriota bacterium]
MTPTTTTKPKLTAAWDKTHEPVVRDSRSKAASAAGTALEGSPVPGPAPKAERTDFKVLNMRIPKNIHKILRRISIETEDSLQNTAIRALSEYATAHNENS